jgi:hypothetical protein
MRGTDPSKAGKGVAFLTPVKGADVRKAAKAEGLAPAEKIATLKVEGNDKPGLGFRITSAIANSRVNLRGVSGIVAGSLWPTLALMGKRMQTGCARVESFGQREEIGQHKANL